MKLFGKRNGTGSRYRIFFATDIHGSDRCFRKFLAAAKAYEANALVLGGDIAGKAVVPIVEIRQGKYEARFQGQTEVVEPSGLHDLKERIAFNGLYPHVIDSAEAVKLSQEGGHREQLFVRVISKQIRSWCELAKERLDPEVPCIITPGNDDPLFVDAVLKESDRIESPEHETLQLGPVWLASMGDTNLTPWDTDREYDEDELARRIDEILGAVSNGKPLLLNFHCPPFDSGLDTVVKLDEELKPVLKGGRPVEIPVGSTAVLEAIKKYRPRVALHGHIHESHGVREIGETLCVNPGSDYASGALKGAIVDFDEEGKCLSYLLTSG